MDRANLLTSEFMCRIVERNDETAGNRRNERQFGPDTGRQRRMFHQSPSRCNHSGGLCDGDGRESGVAGGGGVARGVFALCATAEAWQIPGVAVAEPNKELRFTRARQAHGFWMAAAMLAMAAIVFFLLALPRAENPELPSPWWGLAPLVLAGLAVRTAVRCTRHAYLIFTPIGIEVFPFFRPARGMQVIPWAQIDEMEIDDPPKVLTLHFDSEKSSGVHLSLAPILKDRRALLARAVRGRMESATNPVPESPDGKPENPKTP
jgi:hypothetical protein